MPEEERQRTEKILQRAINVELGQEKAPDPIQVAADGIDISVVGKGTREELVERFC